MSQEGAEPAGRRPSLRVLLRRLRLVWKVNGLFVLILVCILGVSGYISTLDFERASLASARDVSRVTSERVVGRIRGLMMAHEAGDLGSLVNRMASENPAYRDIRLISHGGRIVASQIESGTATVDSTAWPCTVCHTSADPCPDTTTIWCEKVLEFPDGERAVSAVTAIFSEEGCSGAQCHTEGMGLPVLGVLQADFSLARVDALIARRTRNTLISVLLFLVLGTAAAWWMTDRLLGRRLRALREGARRIAAQDYTFRFEDPGADGIAQVVGAFDSMTSELSTTLSELTSARSHLQVIVENSADSIITVDPSGVIMTFNAGAEQMLGYERKEVIGQRIEMIFSDPSERATAVAQLEETEHVRNYFTRFVTKDGEVRDVILTLSRLRAPDGTPIGTMGISKDVTRELELQREVLRSKRMAALGQAITGIQHSIKNVLNVMKGGAYMVRLGFQKDSWEVLTEGWVMVQQGINDMTDMSKSMMDFARTRKLNIKEVDLAELTETIHRLSEVKIKNSGVALKLDLAQDLPRVQCDGEMIRSVVMDLLGNALDACAWKEYEDGDAPRVTIRIQRAAEDGHVQIEVSDNGEGMTEEVKKRVFTPFFSTKKKKGTGMGLAVVTRIVNSHEGNTYLESEPGEGATFKVLLPIQGPSYREE